MIQSPPPPRPDDRGLHGLAVLSRHRRMIAAFTVAGLCLGAQGYALQQPRYIAEAVIALDVRRIQAMPVDQVVTPLPQENPVLRTELDMIASRVMAKRVIARLASDGYPIRAKGNVEEQAPTGAVPRFRSALSGAVGFPGRTKIVEPDPDAALEDQLRGSLDVVNDGRSYTIYIAYSGSDPIVAARVANAYAHAYLDYQDDVQIDATRRVSEWLEERLATLGARLQRAEQGAERFRAMSGLFEIDGVTLAAQRVSALSTELAAARAALATAQSRERTATLLAARENGLDGFNEVLGSPIIQQLRTGKAELERRLQRLRDTGASQSAEMPALVSEIETVQQQVAREIEHVLVSLRNEIDAASGRVALLEAELRSAEAEYGNSDVARVKLEGLLREANADRAVYENLLGRAKQIADRKELTDPGVRLITEASVPARPSSPRLAAALLLGLMAGTGSGIALAFLRERVDDRLRSRGALEAATGIPVLATIPTLPHRRLADPAGQIVRAPRSPFSESFAGLQWMLRRSPVTGRRASVLMVTSAVPGEGKTTLALALARSMATSGRSVVLVDADLHHQAVARMAGIGDPIADPREEAQPGLVEYLTGDVPLEQVLTDDPETSLQFIAAARLTDHHLHLVANKRFGLLIATLRERFEHVIIDTPSIITSSDAAQIGPHVDSTLLVARWGHTTYETVIASIQRLALCGLAVDGLVLNRVPLQLHQSYDRPAPTPAARHIPSAAGSFFSALAEGSQANAREA